MDGMESLLGQPVGAMASFMGTSKLDRSEENNGLGQFEQFSNYGSGLPSSGYPPMNMMGNVPMNDLGFSMGSVPASRPGQDSGNQNRALSRNSSHSSHPSEMRSMMPSAMGGEAQMMGDAPALAMNGMNPGMGPGGMAGAGIAPRNPSHPGGGDGTSHGELESGPGGGPGGALGTPGGSGEMPGNSMGGLGSADMGVAMDAGMDPSAMMGGMGDSLTMGDIPFSAQMQGEPANGPIPHGRDFPMAMGPQMQGPQMQGPQMPRQQMPGQQMPGQQMPGPQGPQMQGMPMNMGNGGAPGMYMMPPQSRGQYPPQYMNPAAQQRLGGGIGPGGLRSPLLMKQPQIPAPAARGRGGSTAGTRKKAQPRSQTGKRAAQPKPAVDQKGKPGASQPPTPLTHPSSQHNSPSTQHNPPSAQHIVQVHKTPAMNRPNSSIGTLPPSRPHTGFAPDRTASTTPSSAAAAAAAASKLPTRQFEFATQQPPPPRSGALRVRVQCVLTLNQELIKISMASSFGSDIFKLSMSRLNSNIQYLRAVHSQQDVSSALTVAPPVLGPLAAVPSLSEPYKRLEEMFKSRLSPAS